MWAARRSLGAFSGSAVRSISGYGSAPRYAADAAAEAASVEVLPEKFRGMTAESQNLLGKLRNCLRKGGKIDLNEGMKDYKGLVDMDALELLLRRGESKRAMPVYEWGKLREGFEYTPGFVINLISLVRISKRMDRVEQIVSEMSGKADPEVEGIARSMLYMGYIRIKDQVNAERVMAEMQEKGQELRPRAMLELMMINLELGGVEKMLATYKEHAAKGLLPDSYGYNRLIITLCSKEKVDDAFQVFMESVEKGVGQSSNTHIALISKLVKTEMVEEARQVAELLLKGGELRTDLGSLKYLMVKLAEQKSYDEAFKMLKAVLKQPRHSNAPSQLMEVLINHKEWDKAMELVKLMKELDVHADAEYSLLISKLCEEKRSTDAKNVFDTMVELGLAPNAEACSALALCASGSQSE